MKSLAHPFACAGERSPSRRSTTGNISDPATLDSLRTAIVACEACPRLRRHCARVAREKRRAFRSEEYWGRPVPGFGDPDARLLIVGLAPAAHGANRTGRVFTGDGAGGSGDFLMAALHRHGFASLPTSRGPDDGLRLIDAYIAAAVRCAPPDNRPLPEEIARCLPHLEAELALLPNVRVVVALGRIGFDACWRVLRRRYAGMETGAAFARRPQFEHGRCYRFGASMPSLVGSYHPSRQNTNTGRLTASMMADVFGTAKRMLR